MRALLLAVPLLAILAGAPARAADPAQPILDADRAFAALAKEAGIGAAFERFSAPKAVVPQADDMWMDAAEWHRVFPPGTTVEFGPEGGMMADGGDMGFTWGKARFTRSGADGRAVEWRTRYLTVWKKQPDGAWRFVADVGVEEPEPPPAAK